MKEIYNRMIGFSLSPSLYSHLNVNDGFQVSLTKQLREKEELHVLSKARTIEQKKIKVLNSQIGS